ncbi:MAG: hypothetical protein QW692_03835 [Nitrososphaerota archaeon]
MADTVFFPPRHKWLAEIIRLDTPENARKAARQLAAEFRRSGRARQLTILRAINLAAIRARIGAKNPNISEKERLEYRVIHGIYRRLYEKLAKEYKKEAG